MATREANTSTYLPSVSWSFANFATADSTTLATANTPVFWDGGTKDQELGPGSFDAVTGLYSIEAAGHYRVDVDVTFAATLATGAEQQVQLMLNGTTVPIGNLKRKRVEATNTTKVRVRFGGITPYLPPGAKVGLAFVSDTNSDTAEVFEASVTLQKVHAQLGTGV